MIAKVMHRDCVYFSPVFAVSMKLHNCKAVVFDSSYEELIVVDIFTDMKHTVLFTDYDTTGFGINEDHLKAFWNDRNIFGRIQHKQYTPPMLEDAKQILSQMQIQEFTKIKSKSDLEALEINSGSFHDGYILGMEEKDGMLEILLDTSWGSLIILRCSGVLENTVRKGVVFDYANMRLRDGYVEIAWDEMCNGQERILKAEQMEFKPLFEKRIPIRKLCYSFADGQLILQQKGEDRSIRVDPAKQDVLNFRERNVLGYLEQDDTMVRCLFLSGEVAYSIHQYSNNQKAFEKASQLVQKLQRDCAGHELFFEAYPDCEESWEPCEQDFGAMLYSQTFGNIHRLSYIKTCILPGYSFYVFVLFVVKLFIREFTWPTFLMVALVIALGFLVIGAGAFFITGILEKRSGTTEAKKLEIYENGIRYNGYNNAFNLNYEHIYSVTYKKRIVVQTVFGKFKLHKTKQDPVIYELISRCIEQVKRRSQE